MQLLMYFILVRLCYKEGRLINLTQMEGDVKIKNNKKGEKER